MATFKQYTSSGGASENFSIPTFSTDEIKVKVSGTLKTAGTHYNITNYTTNGGTVSWISPHTPASGAVVRIYRVTDITGTADTDPRHDYNAGSSIKADALNDNQTQALRAVEELRDEVVDGDSVLDAGDLTPGTEGQFLITNSTPATEWTNRFPDNTKLNFGTSDDLQLWSDGTRGKIFAPTELWLSTAGHNTGTIYIESDSEIIMRDPNDHSEVFAKFRDDSHTSGVELYQGGNVRLTTTSAGVTIHGTLTQDSTASFGSITATNVTVTNNLISKYLTIEDTAVFESSVELQDDVKFNGNHENIYAYWDKSDNALEFTATAKATFGHNQALKIHHTTSNSFIEANTGALYLGGGTGSGNTYVNSQTSIHMKPSNGKKGISLWNNGSVELFDNSGGNNMLYKFATTSTGVFVNGNLELSSSIDGGASVGNIILSGTVDGRDISADGIKLDSAVLETDTTTASMNFVVDEDNMSSDSNTKIPTQQSVKKYVDDQVAGVVDSAPGALDTLNELAAALGDDANFSTTVTNSIATKLPLAGGTMTGNIVMSGSETVDGRDLSVDGTKLDGIESAATADQTAAEIRTLVGSASDSNVFTDADHTKLDGIATSANNYVHPNHSGEVTSTADGATVIADDTVDEANLKISNAGSDGQFLQKQSGNTGGLTWATCLQQDTTYTHTWQDSGDNALLRLTAGGTGSGNDDLTILAGDNIILTPSGDNLTIAASGGEITVQDEGSSLSTAATTLNFVGAGITASGTGASKTITVNGGGPSDFKYLELKAHNNTSGAFSAGSASYELVTLGTTTAITPTAANTLLISIGGVLQKPNTGTTIGSNDGFCLEGSSIHFGANLTAAPDFIVYLQNTGVGEPSDNAVTTAKIADDAVTGAKIADDAVGHGELLDNSIHHHHITDANITTAKIAADAITGAKIADDAVGAEHIEVLDANLQFTDNAKAQFGTTDNDLEIYHDGTRSIIDAATSKNIDFYYNGAQQFWFGDSEFKGVDGKKIILGTHDDLEIFHGANISTIKDGKGDLRIMGDTIRIQRNAGGENYIYATEGGAVKLHFDGGDPKLETTASGVTISGNNSTGSIVKGVTRFCPNDSTTVKAMWDETGMSGAGHFQVKDGVAFSAGNSSDLQIFHDGTDSNLYNNTGNLLIYCANDFYLKHGAEKMIAALDDGAVKLYYDGSTDPKLETHSSGITITGSSYVTGNDDHPDNSKARFGTSDDLQIYHDGNNSWINNTTGALYLKAAASNAVYILDNNNDTLLSATDDAGVVLCWDNAPKFQITSAGAQLTGSLAFMSESTNISILDNGKAKFGNGDDLQIFHDGTSSFISAGNDGRQGYVTYIKNDGNNNNRYGIRIQCGKDDSTGTNYALTIGDGNGTTQGEITFTGGTVTYGTFTAHHPCIIPDADNPSDASMAYPYGTLLETISIEYTQKNGSNTERGIRYKVQKTQSANSRKVLGAYGGSMNGGPDGQTNEHQALILGDGHILVNNAGGNIEVGDGICSSATAGIGQKATANP